ncbi:hypothetical protein B0H16DRAFT_1450992 [Mycena metata]|uniref:HMG box domain-containing protein n=1 Tax=Mycena metata TaxID=1033252 RepID=A0AAD7JWG1_9AGAR|nr:hypothetical protein B0H16DRAFT_1450992 [Mycena metata]
MSDRSNKRVCSLEILGRQLYVQPERRTRLICSSKVQPPTRDRLKTTIPMGRRKTYATRPNNAYMLFRSELSAAVKIDKQKTGVSRNLSTIAAEQWSALSDKKKRVYFLKAEIKKLEYVQNHPGRRHQRTFTTSRRMGCDKATLAGPPNPPVQISSEKAQETWVCEDITIPVIPGLSTASIFDSECDEDSFYILPSNSDVVPWFPPHLLLSATSCFVNPCLLEF